MSYLRYPAYKESRVAWLGEIPAHWGAERIKNVSTSRVSTVDKHVFDGEILVQVCNYTHVYYNRRISSSMPFTQGSVTKEELAAFRLQQGDVIITKDSETAEDIAIPALVVEDVPNLVCGYHLAILRTHAFVLDGKYLYFVQESKPLRAYYTNVARGVTRFGLPYQGIANCPVPLPPLPEQHAIAAFLDRETARIDALIAKQETLIALLGEKRKALICQTVTKGLDRDALMKESNSQFLPPIPKHWLVTKLGYLCRQVSDGPHFSPPYVEETEGILFLSTRNVRVDGWSFEDVKYISKEHYQEFCKRIIPEVGDVLYTKGGTTGIARVVDITQPFHVWVHVAVLKLRPEKVNPYFLAYSLNSAACYDQSQIYTRGATNNDLGLTRMINIVLALPPLSEQGNIVDYLDRETTEINSLIAKAEQFIALLREHRTALIAAAVTGKIDVRRMVDGLEMGDEA